MRPLVPCPRCQRHVRAAETSCPHCGHSNGALTFAALAIGAGLAIAGCSDPGPVAVYGPPPVLPTAREIPTSDATSGDTTTTSNDAPPATTPVPVYGPAPVDPTARLPQPQPTATSTATTTRPNPPAPTTTPDPEPTRPPIKALYGAAPVEPTKRVPN